MIEAMWVTGSTGAGVFCGCPLPSTVTVTVLVGASKQIMSRLARAESTASGIGAAKTDHLRSKGVRKKSLCNILNA